MGGNFIRREGTGNGDWIFLSLKCTSIHLQEISRWYTRTKKWYHYHHGTHFFPHVVFNDTVNGSLYIIMIVPIIIFWSLLASVFQPRDYILSSRRWPLSNFDFPSPRYRKWKNLLSMGGNSSAIVLPVAGKPTEIVRKTLVYNSYFHLDIFSFS